MEILFWCQGEAGNNVNGHPVYQRLAKYFFPPKGGYILQNLRIFTPCTPLLYCPTWGFVGSADRLACSKLLMAKVRESREVTIELIWKRAIKNSDLKWLKWLKRSDLKSDFFQSAKGKKTPSEPAKIPNILTLWSLKEDRSNAQNPTCWVTSLEVTQVSKLVLFLLRPSDTQSPVTVHCSVISYQALAKKI